jgi:hypothetical protein
LVNQCESLIRRVSVLPHQRQCRAQQHQVVGLQ